MTTAPSACDPRARLHEVEVPECSQPGSRLLFTLARYASGQFSRSAMFLEEVDGREAADG